MTITEMLAGNESARRPSRRSRSRAPSVLNEAYDYARPSSFSRGLRLDLERLAILLISGTASIGRERRDASRRRFPRADAGARSTTSRRCSQPKAPPGTTSCAPPATCATSNATTRRSTKSAPPSTRSRISIRCRLDGHPGDPVPAGLLVEIEAIAMFRTAAEGVTHDAPAGSGSGSLAGAARRRCSACARQPGRLCLRRQSARAARRTANCDRTPTRPRPAAVLAIHRAVLRALQQTGGVQRRGARCRHACKPQDVDEVRIGFLGPVSRTIPTKRSAG